MRAIGVCNFSVAHLDRLLAEVDVAPQVNQVELHPFFSQPDLRAAHARLGIVTQAWSPIGGVNRYWGSDIRPENDPLTHPTIVGLAEKHGRTPAQVILRWQLQLGHSIVPKSVRPARIAENFDLFDFALSEDDMAAIGALDTGRRGGPDPDELASRVLRAARSPDSRASAAPAQRLHEEGEGAGGLAPARVVEVVAGERRAPVLEHRLEPAVGDQRRELLVGQAAEAEAVDGRGGDQLGVVAGELALDADVERPAVTLELPRVEAAEGRQAQVDAGMGGQLVRRLAAGRGARSRPGRPATSIRLSGPMRTAIMSRSTLSPSRTPASKRCSTMSTKDWSTEISTLMSGWSAISGASFG